MLLPSCTRTCARVPGGSTPLGAQPDWQGLYWPEDPAVGDPLPLLGGCLPRRPYHLTCALVCSATATSARGSGMGVGGRAFLLARGSVPPNAGPVTDWGPSFAGGRAVALLLLEPLPYTPSWYREGPTGQLQLRGALRSVCACPPTSGSRGWGCCILAPWAHVSVVWAPPWPGRYAPCVALGSSLCDSVSAKLQPVAGW